MGVMIDKIYEVVTEKAGYKGRLELAEKTGISRTKGAEIEDSPEIVSKFKKAAEEIVGQNIEPFIK